MEPEFIEWGGRRWKRTPNSKRRNHRVYYCHSLWRSKEYLHRAIWAASHGPIPAGHDIHHVDDNPFNNDIANLACISRAEHMRGHMQSPARREFSRSVAIKAAIAAAPAWHSSPAGKKWHSENAKRLWRNAPMADLVCEVCGRAFRSKKPGVPARTCGKNCLAEKRRRSGLDDVTASCAECGADFVKNKYSVKRNCSRTCGKRAADRTRGLRVQPLGR